MDSKGFEQFKNDLRQLTDEEWDAFSDEDLAKIENMLANPPKTQLDVARKDVEEKIVKPHMAFAESAVQGFTEFGLGIGQALGLEDPERIAEFNQRRRTEIARDYPGNELAKTSGDIAGRLAGFAATGAGRLIGPAIRGAGSLGRSIYNAGKAIVSSPSVQAAGSLAAKSAVAGSAAYGAVKAVKDKF